MRRAESRNPRARGSRRACLPVGFRRRLTRPGTAAIRAHDRATEPSRPIYDEKGLLIIRRRRCRTSPPYILVEATHHLVTGDKAQASWIGIGLAIISITLMPLFGRAKKRIGNQLHSNATSGEGTQNILCAYLSLAILIGLGANALLGFWWADPIVALIVSIVAIKPGTRTWRGQACDDTC
ncbi:MAG: hypothetical protein E6G60_11825 [Actinobacteria bacterium]|nr:MAG: hypothetical protein E6G60_11825 [Actinomycetota bacterium]